MKSISAVDEQVLRERIVQKAYQLYEKRGRNHGNDLDDWLAAENLVLDELSSQEDSEKKLPKSRTPRSKSRSKRGRLLSSSM